MTYGQLGELVDGLRSSGMRQRRAETVLQRQMDTIVASREGGGGSPVGVPAVFASVRLIASAIDQLQLTAPGDPSWLRDPRLYQSPYHQSALIQHIVTDMLLRGAAFLRVERLGVGWRLLPLDFDAVQVQRVRDEYGVIRPRYSVMGEMKAHVPLPSTSNGQPPWPAGGSWVLHLPYLITSDHPEGVGPLQMAREALEGYLRVERQATQLLDTGTYSGGRLETDQDITKTTAEAYQSRWVENRKLGRLPVLGSGLRYVNDIIDPADAQWLESRQFNAGQVAQMFGIPPDYLGMALAGGSSSLSYNNSADNDRRFRRNCLEALTGPIADGFSTLLEAQRDRVAWDWQAWESIAAEERSR